MPVPQSLKATEVQLGMAEAPLGGGALVELQQAEFDPAPGEPADRLTEYATFEQEQSRWCWAAVSQSVRACLDQGLVIDQCEIAKLVVNRNDCCANPGKCNKARRLDRALRAVECFRGPRKRGRLTLGQLADEILGKAQPVGALLRLGGGGHFVALIGVDTAREDVLIADPQRGEKWMPLDDFPGDYAGGGEWRYHYFTQLGFEA